MKKTEKILAAISFLAVLMNIFSIPGGAFFSITSLGLLSIIYCYLGFALFNNVRLRNVFKKSSYEHVSASHIFGAIGLGFVFSTCLMGILFYLNQWPGAKFFMILSVVSISISAIILVWRFLVNRSVFISDALIRTSIIGGIVFIAFLLPTYALIECKYKNYPSYIEAVKELDKDPANKTLEERVAEEREKMLSR